MGTAIIAAIIVIGISFFLLCIKIVLQKNGRFGSQHISESKAMRERGISCAKSQDRKARRSNPNRINVNEL